MTHVEAVKNTIRAYTASSPKRYPSFSVRDLWSHGDFPSYEMDKNQVSRVISSMWNRGEIIRGGKSSNPEDKGYWYRMAGRNKIPRAVMNQEPAVKKPRKKIKPSRKNRFPLIIFCDSKEDKKVLKKYLK